MRSVAGSVPGVGAQESSSTTTTATPVGEAVSGCGAVSSGPGGVGMAGPQGTEDTMFGPSTFFGEPAGDSCGLLLELEYTGQCRVPVKNTHND